MPEIHFTIDTKTGKLQEAHIEGVLGSGCDDIQKKIEAVFGKPASEERTREYDVRVVGDVAARR